MSMHESSRLIIPFRDTETTPFRRVARRDDADAAGWKTVIYLRLIWVQSDDPRSP